MTGRPNIVIVMADQLRADALSAFGNAIAVTPAFDEVTQRGTTFTNAFAQNPYCVPSRVSLFTGWYPHVSGHRSQNNLLKSWEPNLLRLVRDSGYNVAWVGGRGDTLAPGVTEASTDYHGFAVLPTHSLMEPVHPRGHPLRDSFYAGRRPSSGEVVLDYDEATVRTAEAWLADGPREPWLLFVALVFPHPPFEVEDPWFSMYDRRDVQLPPRELPAGKPSFLSRYRRAMAFDRLSEDDWRELVSVYLGMVSRFDYHLGRVLRSVDAASPAAPLMAVFSDHGDYLGEYGLLEKWPSGMDPGLLRNPLVISSPDGGGGQRCDGLVELTDVFATLVDYAEVPTTHRHFGRSLRGLLDGAGRRHRSEAWSEGGFSLAEADQLERVGKSWYETKSGFQRENPRLLGRAICVRTPDWTFVRRLYDTDELYDRQTDSSERLNLIENPAFGDVVADFRQRTMDWLIETSDVIPRVEDPRIDWSLYREARALPNANAAAECQR